MIKSRLQAAPTGAYTGFVDCARKTVASDGISALFKGFGPAMMRAVPANAATFLGVEIALIGLNKLGSWLYISISWTYFKLSALAPDRPRDGKVSYYSCCKKKALMYYTYSMCSRNCSACDVLRRKTFHQWWNCFFYKCWVVALLYERPYSSSYFLGWVHQLVCCDISHLILDVSKQRVIIWMTCPSYSLLPISGMSLDVVQFELTQLSTTTGLETWM